MTLGKSVIKYSRKPREEDLWNTMIDEEIWLALFRILLGIWCLLMHVNKGKIRNLPVWGKLQIKFPVRTKETEAIMVLLYIINDIIIQHDAIISQLVHQPVGVFFTFLTMFVLSLIYGSFIFTNLRIVYSLYPYARRGCSDHNSLPPPTPKKKRPIAGEDS